ncbi:copper transporter [Ornithinimicrobium panacihumi]|uniref:copper transporter n=1 Tax=Ornithinimicrobium panacihumi TaxID=2008449 RepID=UPI003F8C620F
MIDFRYHLVSLVAVFIALAVGIALGAGPLREGISSTLESEVAQLREERTDLRAQVEHADRLAEAKDGALGLVSERVTGGTLSGVRVGLVVMPGADRNVVDQLEGKLVSAGAIVVLMAEVDPRWDAPNPPADRQETLDGLAELVQAPEPTTGVVPTVATVLAATLAGADHPAHPGGWLTVAAALEDERLVDFTWRDTDPATAGTRVAPEAIVLVPGGLTAAAAAEGVGAEALTQRVDLVDALTRVESRFVVAGTGGESRESDGVSPVDPLVHAVRDDEDLAELVSTVDNLESPTGQLATVLALAWTVQGEPGHYGLGDLAQEVMPSVPPVMPPTPEVPAPGQDDLQDGVQDDGQQDPGQQDPGQQDPGGQGAGQGADQGAGQDDGGSEVVLPGVEPGPDDATATTTS